MRAQLLPPISWQAVSAVSALATLTLLGGCATLGNAVPGGAAFGMGRTDGARELGGLSPALSSTIRSRDINDPATIQAVRANATTRAIHDFVEKDALRELGTAYFGEGQKGETAFAQFSQGLIQWKAFGDNQAYDMLLTGAQQHYERKGYTPKDAVLKASNVVAQAASDPIFAKLIANTYD